MQSRGFLICVACLGADTLWAQEPETKIEKPKKPSTEFSVIAGEANGFGFRYWFRLNMSLEIRAEFDFFPVSAIVLNSAYHLSFAEISRKEGRPIPIYVGGAAKAGSTLDPNFIFGFSAPIGAGLPLGDGPVTAFIELAPGVVFVQATALLDLDANLGIRYSFPPKKK